MVGMLGIPQQFRQHALLVSLAQLQAQSADRAVRFRHSHDENSRAVATQEILLSSTPSDLPSVSQGLPPEQLEIPIQQTKTTEPQIEHSELPVVIHAQELEDQSKQTLHDLAAEKQAPIKVEEPEIRLHFIDDSATIHISATDHSEPEITSSSSASSSPHLKSISSPQPPRPSTPPSSTKGETSTPIVSSPIRSPSPKASATSLPVPVASPALTLPTSDSGSNNGPQSAVSPRNQGPINATASRQLWELLAGTKGLPDCATLIAARADVECRNGDRGQTPLMQACFSGQREMAAILIRAGADVNAKDLSANQQTPLLYAVFAGKSNMVDLLIKNGANPNEKDLHGYTALMYAVHYGQPEVAAYLVRDAGCSVWDTDPHGRSAFKLALDKAPKDQGKILGCVCRALFERGQSLPSDPEKIALTREALLVIAHEQCRQLRAVMKVHHDNHGMPVFVIDSGSNFIRAGLSTAKPIIFPSVRGSLKGEVGRSFLTQGGATSFLGDEALQKKQLLQLTWPLRKEWDLKFLEDAWEKAFNLCQVEPSDCAVVITQPRSFAQEGGQQKIAAMQELLFQRFSVQLVSVIHSAAAASLGPYGLQCPVHLSLHVGFSMATVMVWVDGKPTFSQSKIGGSDCTDYLQKNCDWGLGETSSKVWDVVNSIKEGKAYCLPFASAPPRDEKETWSRPDGTALSLGPELACAAEVLFDPNLVGKRSFGLPQLVRDAIQTAPASAHAALWANIVVSGGSTLFPGFDERLVHELKQLDRSQCGGSCTIRIVNPPGRARSESAWRGACSLFTTPAYFGCLVNQEEFEESAVLLSKVRADGSDSLTSLAALETR